MRSVTVPCIVVYKSSEVLPAVVILISERVCREMNSCASLAFALLFFHGETAANTCNGESLCSKISVVSLTARLALHRHAGFDVCTSA